MALSGVDEPGVLKLVEVDADRAVVHPQLLYEVLHRERLGGVGDPPKDVEACLFPESFCHLEDILSDFVHYSRPPTV